MEKYMGRECTLLAGPAGGGLRLYTGVSGGQKMPSLKADDCLTLMSILVDPQVKRHTSSFDRAFICADAPDMYLHTYMWLLVPEGTSA